MLSGSDKSHGERSNQPQRLDVYIGLIEILFLQLTKFVQWKALSLAGLEEAGS